MPIAVPAGPRLAVRAGIVALDDGAGAVSPVFVPAHLPHRVSVRWMGARNMQEASEDLSPATG